MCLVAAGCGGNGGGNGATATSTQTAAKPAAAKPGFDEFEALHHGRTYTTTVFNPAIRFTVPRGPWSSEEGDSARDFAIAAKRPPSGVFQAILAVHRVSQVYDPKRGGTVPGDRVALRGTFVHWLRTHPRLRILADRPTRLMGLGGTLIDVSGKSQPSHVPRECRELGPDCAPLFYAGVDPVVYARTSRGRFIVLKLPDGGELVVEQFVDPARSFARALRYLRPLLGRLALAE
jgi:hypothetical protein